MQQLLVISPQLVERMCAQLWSSYTRSPLTEENTFTALSLSAARFHRKCWCRSVGARSSNLGSSRLL